jgi:hypothetical protein
MEETTTTPDTNILMEAVTQSVRLETKMRALQFREMKRKADRREERNKRCQIQREKRQRVLDSCQQRDDEFIEFTHHMEHNEAMALESFKADQNQRARYCSSEREKAKMLNLLDKKIKLADLNKDYELDSFCTTTQKEKHSYEAKKERRLLQHRRAMILHEAKLTKYKTDYELTVKYGVQMPNKFFN